MCGRFAVTTDPARLAVELDALDETGEAGLRPPNYNVAPSTDIAVVVARHDQAELAATRRIRLMRWGLLPPWTKPGPDGGPPTRGPQLINARAETVTTSPAYRSAAQHKRCLIPMDGYYEWKPAGESSGANPKRGRKTPFFFYRPDGRPLLPPPTCSLRGRTFGRWLCARFPPWSTMSPTTDRNCWSRPTRATNRSVCSSPVRAG
jgi:putative SOS response-associated peptidase YedK